MHEPRKHITSLVCTPGVRVLPGGTPEPASRSPAFLHHQRGQIAAVPDAAGQPAQRSTPIPLHAPDELLEQDYEDRVSGGGALD